MNRTTLGYFVMAVCSAGVLWAILKFGSHLEQTAPPDWAGKWQVAEPAVPAREAEIQQSGVYFHVRLGDDPVRPYKLERRSDHYVLAGQGESREAYYDVGDKLLSLKLIDPAGQAQSVRLVRERKPTRP